MSKDGQIDPKQVRAKKSGGGTHMAQSESDGEGRNAKKQSGSRNQAGDDPK